MIHTSITQNCVVIPFSRRLTPSAIYGSQIFDSHKWPTVLVRIVKGKPHNFVANLYGSLYSTFKTSSQSYAFKNKLLQTLFIDQLVRSKATCSFNCVPFTAPGIHTRPLADPAPKIHNGIIWECLKKPMLWNTCGSRMARSREGLRANMGPIPWAPTGSYKLQPRSIWAPQGLAQITHTSGAHLG